MLAGWYMWFSFDHLYQSKGFLNKQKIFFFKKVHGAVRRDRSIWEEKCDAERTLVCQFQFTLSNRLWSPTALPASVKTLALWFSLWFPSVTPSGTRFDWLWSDVSARRRAQESALTACIRRENKNTQLAPCRVFAQTRAGCLIAAAFREASQLWRRWSEPPGRMISLWKSALNCGALESQNIWNLI